MKFVYLLPAIVWFFVIFWIISIPGSSIPKTPLLSIPHFDKLVHTGMFAAFVFLLIYGLEKQSTGLFFRYHYTFPLIIGVIYSISTEWFQYMFVPGRVGEIWDVAANITGCFTGSVMFYYRRRFLPAFLM